MYDTKASVLGFPHLFSMYAQCMTYRCKAFGSNIFGRILHVNAGKRRRRAANIKGGCDAPHGHGPSMEGMSPCRPWVSSAVTEMSAT